VAGAVVVDVVVVVVDDGLAETAIVVDDGLMPAFC